MFEISVQIPLKYNLTDTVLSDRFKRIGIKSVSNVLYISSNRNEN